MTTPEPPAPPVDEALQQRVAQALANQYTDGDPDSGMMSHFIAEDGYGSMAPVTPNEAAAVVLAELAPELAELLDYRNRIAWETTCGGCARTLDGAYAETARAEQAEAALDRVRKLADRWDRDAPPPGNRPLTELRTALDTPTQETP